MCRVALRVPTTNQSEISMEAWLPSNWTGRFLSTGNGGTSGCIQYEDMAYASDLGFATVGANNGHNGTRGIAFGQNEDVVLDFAWRSVHTGVVVGKHISETFYGKTHTKSYYLGCSTGGRQGFKSAQSFPDDFDGVVAGAPAIAFNNLTSWSGSFYTNFRGNDTERYIPAELWATLIHEDILKQCDGLDGVEDGIIEDPDLCQYRPEALLCASNATDTSNCLTGPQVDAVRQVFSGVYGVDGSLVYPRMQPGSEVIAANVLYSGSEFIYTSDWFRYAIYHNTSWDPLNLSPEDMAYSAKLNLGNIQTWDDLSAFKAKGGKLLHYHGLMDAIISSDNSPRYYNYLSRTMGLNSAELDDFYRFFRISGMSHCRGGDGAWAIGNQRASRASLDPDANALMAMVRWVEEGVAPEKLIGTKWVNNTESLGVEYTRAHCKYPARNVYKGSGDGTDPEGWECVV
ncbi:Tannase/feruloyl esterase [Macrophomina phaseolina MS6]|uniref:Carboxylic ester hydrolase n=1 Tax=Macrophomina phaseolina (strain MS6) TaxID=1126212 RepID=K2RD58_MACPH|nr:Tannase/feruloyl esterase [Macrophomina phaseolina MS6]